MSRATLLLVAPLALICNEMPLALICHEMKPRASKQQEAIISNPSKLNN